MITDLFLLITWAVPGAFIKFIALASQGLAVVPIAIFGNFASSLDVVLENAMRFDALFPVAITLTLLVAAFTLEVVIITIKFFIFIWGLARGFRPIK